MDDGQFDKFLLLAYDYIDAHAKLELNLEQIRTLLRLYFKPYDKQDFNLKFNLKVRFMAFPLDYEVSILNFLPMFEANCIFKDDYSGVYDFWRSLMFV